MSGYLEYTVFKGIPVFAGIVKAIGDNRLLFDAEKQEYRQNLIQFDKDLIKFRDVGLGVDFFIVAEVLVGY